MIIKTPTIASRATGLAAVLAYAAEVGLPAPYTATVDDFRDHVELTVNQVADLAEWALALESVVKTSTGVNSLGRCYTIHRTGGELLELGVMVVAWDHAPEATA